MHCGGQQIDKTIYFKRKCFDVIAHVVVIALNLARILVLLNVLRRMGAKDYYCRKIQISGMINGSKFLEIKVNIVKLYVLSILTVQLFRCNTCKNIVEQLYIRSILDRASSDHEGMDKSSVKQCLK